MLTKGWYRTALVSSPQVLHVVIMAHSAPIFITAMASAASWLIEINGLPSNLTQDEASASGEARMSKMLRAFDVRFGGGDKPPAAKSNQEEE